LFKKEEHQALAIAGANEQTTKKKTPVVVVNNE
jgi:hypothetical protein